MPLCCHIIRFQDEVMNSEVLQSAYTEDIDSADLCLILCYMGQKHEQHMLGTGKIFPVFTE